MIVFIRSTGLRALSGDTQSLIQCVCEMDLGFRTGVAVLAAALLETTNSASNAKPREILITVVSATLSGYSTYIQKVGTNRYLKMSALTTMR